jgi:pteridine reductase
MNLTAKTALITGASRRLGAQTARTLHQNGANIIIHYGNSKLDAEQLVAELNQTRPDSATCMQADLRDTQAVKQLGADACAHFAGLDILINNASSFYPTPIGSIDEDAFDDLFATNFKAPMFLAQACYPALKQAQGCIINMVDIHARAPIPQHTVYCSAKAANAMLTRSLALEMGPEVRVNGVAPGAILWPESGINDNQQQQILQQVPLARTGSPQDIADTILFLLTSDYVNGQIIAVDGGRQLF